MIEHSELLKILRYDPSDGCFYWNTSRPKVRVGQKAGHLHHKGYINLEIKGKHYAAHRLAWFYVTGSMPTHQIDHINCDKSDNRFVNLREATNGQNRANTKTNNPHGLKGVRYLPWISAGKRCWQASIRHNKKSIYLGCFHTKEEAHFAYCAAARDLHGEFYRP